MLSRHALCIVLTDSLLTSVQFKLAPGTDVVLRAGALKSRAKITTDTSIVARFTNATVGRYLAVLAVNALGANAEIVGNQVDTMSIVMARVQCTRAVLLLASGALPTPRAFTPEHRARIDTSTIVHARLRGTLINVNLA